jgi:hypothetical protein
VIANEDNAGCGNTLAAAFISCPHGGDSRNPTLLGWN